MPTLLNAVPKYRKHKASGQAVVTIGGVDHYLGPHGTKASKNEYDRVIAEWMANGRQLHVGTSDGLFERGWGWWRFRSPERRDYSRSEVLQLVDLERRGAEVLTNRESYVIKNKADLPVYNRSNSPRPWFTREEVEALGLPESFIAEPDDDE